MILSDKNMKFPAKKSALGKEPHKGYAAQNLEENLKETKTIQNIFQTFWTAFSEENRIKK